MNNSSVCAYLFCSLNLLENIVEIQYPLEVTLEATKTIKNAKNTDLKIEATIIYYKCKHDTVSLSIYKKMCVSKSLKTGVIDSSALTQTQ